MQEEEIDAEELINELRKTPKKYIIAALIVCLILLCSYLGFIYGYNQAFNLQKDHYETKIIKYCICQDKPTYSVTDKELDFPIVDSK